MKKIYFELFTVFMKIGAFTFGGGYAMIPIIQRETSEKRGWVDEAEILDIISIAESTPGPISVNAATYIGCRAAGIRGAFFAVTGLVTPPFFTILILSSVIKHFYEYPVVVRAFTGIRMGVTALIIKALASMAKQCPKNLFSYIIAAAAFSAVVFFGTNVLAVIAAAAATGFAHQLIAKNKGDL